MRNKVMKKVMAVLMAAMMTVPGYAVYAEEDTQIEAQAAAEAKAKAEAEAKAREEAEAAARAEAERQAAEAAAYYLGKYAPNTELIETLGPAPAPMNLLRGRYRYRLLLKTAKNVNIQEVLKKWLGMVKVKSNVRVDVDINPYSFM